MSRRSGLLRKRLGLRGLGGGLQLAVDLLFVVEFLVPAWLEFLDDDGWRKKRAGENGLDALSGY